jgi:hypothetical protein
MKSRIRVTAVLFGFLSDGGLARDHAVADHQRLPL